MLSRRGFVIGGGSLAAAGATYGGYRFWRWNRGRSPRIFDRDIFQIGGQEMTGVGTGDGAHVLIADRETAGSVLEVDDEIDGFLRETDFDDQFIVGILAHAQSAAELFVSSVEHREDGVAIALSFSYPMGPGGDDSVPYSALIRLDGEELPDAVATTVSGRI